MTKITYIPGEIANAAIDEHGNRKPVTRTHHIFDDAKDKNQAEVNAEVDDTFAFHQSEINALNSQNYVTVNSFSSLPATGAVDTVYRVSNWDGTQQDPSVYSEYAWNGSQYVHLSTKTQIGEVFDISAYHATGGELAKYADLAAALGTNGANIPDALRKGGMSVKFVQSSDNKYVQFRLIAQEFTTDVTKWQGVDNEPTAGSNNLVKSGGVYRQFVKNYGIKETDSYKYIVPGFINNSNVWKCELNTQALSLIIPVSEGDTIKLVDNNTDSYYAFLTSNVLQNGEVPAFVSGTTRSTLNTRGYIMTELIVPATCTYVYISCVTNAGVSSIPSIVKKNSTELIFDIVNIIKRNKAVNDIIKTKELINIGDCEIRQAVLNASYKWNYNANNFSLIIPIDVQASDILTFTASSTIAMDIASSITDVEANISAHVSSSGERTLTGNEKYLIINLAFEIPYIRINDIEYIFTEDVRNLIDTRYVAPISVNKQLFSLTKVHTYIDSNGRWSYTNNSYYSYIIPISSDGTNIVNIIGATRYALLEDIDNICKPLSSVHGTVYTTAIPRAIPVNIRYIVVFVSDNLSIYIDDFDVLAQKHINPLYWVDDAAVDTKNLYLGELKIMNINLNTGIISNGGSNFVISPIPIKAKSRTRYVYGDKTGLYTYAYYYCYKNDGTYLGRINFGNLSVEGTQFILPALYKQNDAEALLATKEISVFEGNTVLSTDVPKKIAKEYIEGMSELDAVHNTSNSNKLFKDILKLTHARLLEDAFSESEENKVNEAFEKIETAREDDKLVFALCTDTHIGGAYAEDLDMSSERNVAVINKFANHTVDIGGVDADCCNGVIHCGDVSCDYGTSVNRELAYMREAIKLFKFNKPFFISKGNHDEKNNEYSEVDLNELDWNRVPYYTRNGSVFTLVTEDTWDGSDLFRKDATLITDDEFKTWVQKYKSPANAVWGNGAYYYYDYDDYKVRVIVANSFAVDDNREVDYEDEIKWFMGTALNLSSKREGVEPATDWLVLCVRHTESTSGMYSLGENPTPEQISLKDMYNIVHAFMTGGEVTKYETLVNYTTLNGGGIKFVHIHGHEHSYAGYSNAAGYLDIGFKNASTKMENIGTPYYYNLYTLVIDNGVTKRLVTNMLGGQSIEYNIDDNIVELKVGQKILLAKSGLGSAIDAVWTIVDPSVVDIQNAQATALAAGETSVTGTYGGKSVTYTIRVVN